MRSPGNFLLVANYPSDTPYAWWLMEHFWICLKSQFKKGDEQFFLIYPQVNSISDRILAENLRVLELDFDLQNRQCRAEILRFIRKHHIKNVYLTDRPFFDIHYFLLRLAGVRNIVVHDHSPGDRPEAVGIKGIVKRLRNKLSWFTADRQFCVSPLMIERAVKSGCISPTCCDLVQNGIEPITPSDNARQAVRQSLDIDDDCLMILSTGRVHPVKRIDFIVETIAQALRDPGCPKLTLVHAGDGPAMDALQASVNELGIGDYVKLLGYRNDVPDLLSAADLAFHAANAEAFSLSIVEYMSAGLPVFITDRPSVCQAIKHGETGIIYPHSDVAAAAAALIRLLRNPDAMKAMGALGKQRADAQYTLAGCTEDFAAAAAKAFST